jgi:hypothetical protein
MAIGVSKKADVCKMVFRPFDPAVYGFICPQCQKRWGELNGKEINVMRCDDCPPFVESGVCWWGLKKKRQLKKELKGLKS